MFLKHKTLLAVAIYCVFSSWIAPLSYAQNAIQRLFHLNGGASTAGPSQLNTPGATPVQASPTPAPTGYFLYYDYRLSQKRCLTEQEAHKAQLNQVHRIRPCTVQDLKHYSR